MINLKLVDLKKQCGFSLIELLCTVTMLLFIAGFATPSFQSVNSFHMARDAATTVLLTLQICRSQALMSSGNARCSVNFDSTNDELITEAAFRPGDAGDWRVFHRAKQSVNDRLVSSSVSNAEVIFDEYGNANSSVTLQICSLKSNAQKADYLLNLNRLGLVSFTASKYCS